MPDPTCPTCGRTMRGGCLPNSCPHWGTTAVYDHAASAWLPTDDDGFVLDGRRIEELTRAGIARETGARP